jgi:hypothetical protein
MATYNPIKKDDQKRAVKYLDRLLKGTHKFRIEKLFPKVLFNLHAIHLGYSLIECKQFVKDELGYSVYDKANDEKYYISTSEMNTKQVNLLIERFRHYASMNGYYLPTANEYKYNWWSFEDEIKKHAEYL